LFPISLFLGLALLLRLDDIAERKNGSALQEYLRKARALTIPVLLSTMLYAAILALGTVLLIVPGIFLSVSLMFYMYAQVFENSGVTESLKRSRALLEGNWRHAATVLFITFLTDFAMTLPPSLAAASMAGDTKSAVTTFIVEGVAIVASAFGKILMSAVTLTLYRNLQMHDALHINQSPLA